MLYNFWYLQKQNILGYRSQRSGLRQVHASAVIVTLTIQNKTKYNSVPHAECIQSKGCLNSMHRRLRGIENFLSH